MALIAPWSTPMLEPQETYESYDSYIRLPLLLDAQHPRSSPEERPVWAAERSFIVCHQISELCLSQILLDIDLAAGSVEPPADRSATGDHLARAASLTAVLIRILGQLATVCPPHVFMRFRAILQGISASESRQFREFLRLLDGTHASVRILRATLEGPGDGLSDGAGEHHRRAAHALAILLRLATLWRALHVVIAKHFIHGLPGTGGSAGVAYLSKRFAKDHGHSGSCAPCPTSAAPTNASGLLGACEQVESLSIGDLLDLSRALESELRGGPPAGR